MNVSASRSNPPDSDGALHIFNWASSSAEHYRRMLALVKYPRAGNMTTAAAGQAFTLATETYRAMKGDRDEYSPEDILAAGMLFLAWEGEE